MDTELRMMINYFHTSFGDTILFQNWLTTSRLNVLAFCAIFFVISFTYEALKYLRELMFHKNLSSHLVDNLYSLNKLPATSGNQNRTKVISLLTTQSSPSNCNRLSFLNHLVQSFFHTLQVLIGYTLMLGFMIMNTWICVSIIVGAGCGYFTFFYRKFKLIPPAPSERTNSCY